jgi:hypothetical protein
MHGVFSIRNCSGILQKYYGCSESREDNIGITEQSLYIGDEINDSNEVNLDNV